MLWEDGFGLGLFLFYVIINCFGGIISLMVLELGMVMEVILLLVGEQYCYGYV